MKRVLLLASHAVAEYDDVRMFTDLGYDVFAPGGYETPGRAPEGIRPPLDSPAHPELVARLHEVRAGYQMAPGPLIDWAKARLHDDIIDWADVIICHHFPEQWIGGQWNRIRDKRVIWRTCGQSDPRLERVMSQFSADGMEIVRYSPAEKRYFETTEFAGETTLIRFGKYPQDYGPWVGDLPVVGNVTQDLVNRGDACGYDYWRKATEGLPAKPAGKGSEAIDGLGSLSYEAMLDYLRHIRVYLYTGTVPASYTLGLIEAALSGVPIVSIGAQEWHGPAALFEGWEFASDGADSYPPDRARQALAAYLADPELARRAGERVRQAAIETFDVAKIGQQWCEFLG